MLAGIKLFIDVSNMIPVDCFKDTYGYSLI